MAHSANPRPETADPARVQSTPATARKRRWFGLVSLIVVGGALGALVGLAWPADAADAVLVVTDDGSINRIEPATEAVTTYSGAAISADGASLYQAVPTDDGTEVRSVDVDTGEFEIHAHFDEQLEIRSVAPTGAAVALMPLREEPATGLYEPESRDTTRLAVLWADQRPPRIYDLDGNFEPETFSLDGSVIYLLEFFPALEPDRYFVRQLDLETGEVADVYSPNVELEPEMRGVARDQVLDPDSTFLYTLYSLEPGDDPLADPGAPGQDRYAFVHVLSLEEDWSFCIFLPEPIGTTEDAKLSIAVSPDGSMLYVTDASTATVVAIETDFFTVVDQGAVPQLQADARSGPLATAVGRDGRLYALTGGGAIIALNPDLETLERIWFSERPSFDLQISSDGRQLRVAQPGQVVLVDIGTGQEVASLVVPGEGLGFIGPAGSAIQEGSIGCAC